MIWKRTASLRGHYKAFGLLDGICESEHMAKLFPYLGVGTKSGSLENIWIEVLGQFLTVGTGSFAEVSEYALSFAGRIDAMFIKSDLNLSLVLIDQDPLSASGPCQISINGTASVNASYSANPSQLAVTAQLPGEVQQRITIEPGGIDRRETYLGLSGKHNLIVHLAPSK